MQPYCRACTGEGTSLPTRGEIDNGFRTPTLTFIFDRKARGYAISFRIGNALIITAKFFPWDYSPPRFSFSTHSREYAAFQTNPTCARTTRVHACAPATSN